MSGVRIEVKKDGTKGVYLEGQKGEYIHGVSLNRCSIFRWIIHVSWVKQGYSRVQSRTPGIVVTL